METLTVGYAHDIYGQIILDDNGELHFTGERATVLKKLFADLQKHPISPMTEIELYHSLPKRLRSYYWASFKSQVKFNPFHDDRGRFAVTPASLSASLHKKHPEVTFNLEGLALQDAKDIAAQIDTDLTRYPGVKKSLNYVGTAANAPKEYKEQMLRQEHLTIEEYLVDTTGAITMGNGEVGRHYHQSIIFNEGFYNGPNREQYERYSEEEEWHQPLKKGVSYATYDTKHEFGHVLMNQLIVEGSGSAFLPYTDGDTGRIQPTFTKWANDHMKEEQGTSGYAYNSGFPEAWAEGYAQEGMAKYPQPFSKRVHNALDVFYTPEGEVRTVRDPVDISNKPEERAKAEKLFAEASEKLWGKL